MSNNKLVLSVKYGDIDGDSTPEKVTLLGIPFDENSIYIDTLELVIEKDNVSKQVFKIPGGGYIINLFLGNILSTKEDQIVISGQYGGTGSFALFRLYQYKNNKLKLILDDESLSAQINCYATYEKNNIALVTCRETNKRYTIDISKNYEGYLDLIYDQNGNIKPYTEPIVSDVNTVYPILTPYNDFYSIQTQQRIVGVSNSDTLGAIQSVLEVNEQGVIDIKEQYLLQFGEDLI